MAGLTLEIGNDFAALRPASERLREFLAECGAPVAASFLADLVLEELVTNTIKYGYDDAAAHAIHVDVDFAAGRLGIAVRDDGHPFDPLTLPAPDITLPAKHRDIGGLGLHLVRQMTDSLNYERREGWNIVRAVKDFPPA